MLMACEQRMREAELPRSQVVSIDHGVAITLSFAKRILGFLASSPLKSSPRGR